MEIVYCKCGCGQEVEEDNIYMFMVIIEEGCLVIQFQMGNGPSIMTNV